MQFATDAVVLVQHHTLPLAASLHVEPFRLSVGPLYKLRVIDIDARLPRERLGHDVFTVAVVIAKLRVVRAAERQVALQLSLLILVLAGVDAPLQLAHLFRTRQLVVVVERAFLYECPCLLLLLPWVHGYGSLCFHTHAMFSLSDLM